MYNKQKILQQYKNTDVESQVFSATPHKRVSFLYEAAIRHARLAKIAAEKKQIEPRALNTGKLMDIVSSLRASLDHGKGGELAQQLDALYDFILRHALEASKTSSPEKYDVIVELLSTLKDGWDNMPEKYRVLDDGALEKLRAEAG
jgi:flagellar protein FliS